MAWLHRIILKGIYRISHEASPWLGCSLGLLTLPLESLKMEGHNRQWTDHGTRSRTQTSQSDSRTPQGCSCSHTHTYAHTTFFALEICTRVGTCQTVRVIFRALFSLPTGCVFDGTILGKNQQASFRLVQEQCPRELLHPPPKRLCNALGNWPLVPAKPPLVP